MKRTLLGIALAIWAPIAAQAGSCEQTYATAHGDSLRRIAKMAYAAPMLPILAARNPHITSVRERLKSGVIVTLPCLHNLPQYAPRVRKLRGEASYQVASR